MSKHLPPTAQNGVHKRTQMEVLVRVRQSLEDCNNDIDEWCARLGLVLRENDDVCDAPIAAYLFGKKVYIRSGLTNRQKAEAVAHEYAHYIFHAATTPFETMSVLQVNRDEREARAFAEAIKEFFI